MTRTQIWRTKVVEIFLRVASRVNYLYKVKMMYMIYRFFFFQVAEKAERLTKEANEANA